MINYFNSKLELDNKKDRVLVLKEEIRAIENKMLKITSTLKDSISNTNIVESKIHTLTIEKITKENEIKELVKEIRKIEPIVKRMANRIYKMPGLKRKIFFMHYKDGIKIKEIARLTHFSKQRIYQLKNELDNYLKN